MGFFNRVAFVIYLQLLASSARRTYSTGTFSVNLSASGQGIEGCSVDDMTTINAKGSGNPATVGTYPNIVDTCAKEAYSVFSGFQKPKFFECVKSQGMDVSASCGECIVAPVEYGTSNCKALCLTGTCGHMCQMCTRVTKEQLVTCAGHPMPTLSCDKLPTIDTGLTNGCSNDDMAVVNGKGSGKIDTEGTYPNIVHACTKKSYSIFSGFDQDAFKMCLKEAGLGVSDTCTTCITSPVVFGIENCKAYCATSSCNEYCKMCTQDANMELSKCAGHTMPNLEC